jgi:hypothetical protein
MIINNAANYPLGTAQNVGTLPDMSTTLLDYFQQMTFTVIVKTVVNYVLVETPTSTSFQGVWQPLSPQKIAMKDIGQREWQWNMLHADPSLSLSVDDEIVYNGTQFRVDSKTDYTSYGYIEYHLVNDYT